MKKKNLVGQSWRDFVPTSFKVGTASSVRPCPFQCTILGSVGGDICKRCDGKGHVRGNAPTAVEINGLMYNGEPQQSIDGVIIYAETKGPHIIKCRKNTNAL